MSTFRYQAVETGGSTVKGVIEAEDRRSALQLLGSRGLFPSTLEACASPTSSNPLPKSSNQPAPSATTVTAGQSEGRSFRSLFDKKVSRKQVTAFTREISALLDASIPIPQALDSLGQEEEEPALKEALLSLSESVRKGQSFSAALEEHPALFSKLYVSMVRVGEEAGVLPKVMNDLADFLEHDDEVRGEVMAAIAYPMFVLGFGVVTVAILLTVVMPRLFSMLQEMLTVLPLPTLILLKVSKALQNDWFWILLVIVGATAAIRWYVKTPTGADNLDRFKLRVPVVGSLFRAAALGRFARTLGTLVQSGVSLLPALKIVENTIGNRILSVQIAQVAEETRGGDSLAGPLRKLNIFPRTVVQMIDVGEESGKLDEMLLKVADIEERHMRAHTKTLISLLAPILILIVGALVGFMVIALLLPIFKMSRAVH